MSFLLFVGCAFILTAEGRAGVALLAGPHLTNREQWALGFPLGAFADVLLFFVYTIFGIPLTAFAVFFGHLYLIAMLGALSCQRKPKSLSSGLPDSSFRSEWYGASRSKKAVFAILLISVLLKMGYGTGQALIYPTYYYDSISQWTMRARISYEDRAIAFDADEVRGLSKPQYPILLHSLQIFFELPRKSWLASRSPSALADGEGWSDTVANASTLLFTLFSLAAFFLLLARGNGFFFSLLTLAVVLAIPLVPHHLAQGLGDIHVMASLLLSAVLFLLFTDKRSMPLLLISALFVAETAWIKLDGLIFGVLPWIIIIGMFMLFAQSQRQSIMLRGILPATLLGGAWSAYLLWRGLPISPHGGDFRIQWHAEAIPEVLRVLFASGSFGVHWYAVVLGLGVGFFLLRKSALWRQSIPELLICLWGGIIFCGALIIFLATPNVSFLLNAQTFSRTMLLPLSLFVLGTLLLVRRGIFARSA